MKIEFPSYYAINKEKFRDELASKLHRNSFFFTEKSINAAAEWYKDRVAFVSQRVVISKFHEWREKGGYSPSGKTNNAYLEFDELLKSESTSFEFVDSNFPKLRNLKTEIYANSIAAVYEIFERFYRDRGSLKALGIKDSSIIEGLVFNDEETHNGGRTAVRVSTDSGHVFYKPRSGLGEIILDTVCTFLGADRWTLVAETIDREEYCWQRYISNCTLNRIDTDRYMRSVGILLGACYILGTTDLHADNVRCSTDGNPIIIDAETFLQYRLIDNMKFDATDVLSSGLLPTVLPRSSFWRSFSGINFFPDDPEPEYTVYNVCNSGTDAVSLKKSKNRRTRKNGAPGLSNIDAERAFRVVIDTFNEVRKTVDRNELHKYLRKIKYTSQWRQILRGTGVYQAIIEACLNPDALAGATYPAELLSSGPRGIGECVGSIEQAQIARADVPFFLMDNSGRLTDKNNTFSLEVNFSTRTSDPDIRLDDFCGRNGRLLLNILEANSLAICAEKSDGRSEFLEIMAPTLREEILYNRINEESDNSNRWLCYYPTKDSLMFDADSLSFLYSEGTAWALGLSRDSINESLLNRWLNIFNQSVESSSNFESFGPGTALLTCLSEKQQISGQTVGRIFKAFLGHLTGKLTFVEYDFLGGIEAFIAALAHFPDSALDYIPEGDIEKLVAWTGARLSGQISTEHHGIAHGAAGSLLAAHGVIDIARRAGVIIDRTWFEAYQVLIDNVAQTGFRQLSDDGLRNPLAWCTGASGIVGAIAISGMYSGLDSLIDKYLHSVDIEFSDLTESKDEPIDISLCHGISGVLMTIELLRQLGFIDGEYSSRYRTLLKKEIFKRSLYCGYKKNSRDMGYLNGLGGLYHMLYPDVHTKCLPLFAGHGA